MARGRKRRSGASRAGAAVFDLSEALCSVCLRGESTEADPILGCDRCNETVHLECAGVGTPPAPDDAWLCVPCTHGEQSQSFLTCVLCNNIGIAGGMTLWREEDEKEAQAPPDGEDRKRSAAAKKHDERWVHICCQARHKELTERSLDPNEAEAKCSLCAQPVSRHLCCKTCEKSEPFHPFCGLWEGYFIGYSATECPACVWNAKREKLKARVLSILTEKQDDKNFTLGRIVSQISGGAYDRTCFDKSLDDFKTCKAHLGESIALVRRLTRMAFEASQSQKTADQALDNVLDLLDIYDENSTCSRIGAARLQSAVVTFEVAVTLENVLARVEGGKAQEGRVPRRSAATTAAENSLEGSLLINFDWILQDIDALNRSTCQIAQQARVRLLELADAEAAADGIQYQRLEYKSREQFPNYPTQVYKGYPTCVMFGGRGKKKRYESAALPGNSSQKQHTPAPSKKRAARPKSMSHDRAPMPKRSRLESLFERNMDAVDDCTEEVRFHDKPTCLTTRDYNAFKEVGYELHRSAESEPYFRGRWNKTAYPRRSYELLSDYEASPELDEEYHDQVRRILTSRKQVACGENLHQCRSLIPFDYDSGSFKTDIPCKQNNYGCGVSAIANREDLVAGRDVVEQDVWGIDCYTRRNIAAVLMIAAGYETEDEVSTYVHNLLLSVIACQPAHRAHNIICTLQTILGVFPRPPSRAIHPDHRDYYSQRDDPVVGSKAKKIVDRVVEKGGLSMKQIEKGTLKMLFAVRNWGLDCFRIHPKGAGVVCNVDNVKGGTFITNYVGEVFPPWRWLEKQDAIKQAMEKLSFKPLLPDFYNIMLERHDDDPDGYGVAFVDPIIRGNYASRLSHSCDPNCATVVMVANGQYKVAMYALRDIAYGEELTHDYSSVTEDAKEVLAATCLCGSRKCRGSYLSYTGEEAFDDVIDVEHTPADRMRAIVHACADDPARRSSICDYLSGAGFKSLIVDRLPVWLLSWAARTLRFARSEEVKLGTLLAKQVGRYPNPESAQAEARGVFRSRKQNIAIVLDRVRHYFDLLESRSAHAGNPRDVETQRPLEPLSAPEVSNYLWNGELSLASQALNSALDAVSDALSSNQSSKTYQYWQDICIILAQLLDLWREHRFVQSQEDAQQLLRVVRNAMYNINEDAAFVRFNFEVVGDILTMAIHTKRFFRVREFGPVSSRHRVNVRNVDIGKDGSVVQSVRGSGPRTQSATSDEPKPSVTSAARGAGEQVDAQALVESTLGQSEGAHSTFAASTPYWYRYDQSLGRVAVCFCQRKDFAHFSYSDCDGATTNFRLGGCGQVEGRYHGVVLSIPMPGCFPVFAYALRGKKKKGNEENETKHQLARFSRGDPAPLGSDWECVGLFYSFGDQHPGVQEFRVAGSEDGSFLSLYGFSDEFFKSKVEFQRVQFDGGDSTVAQPLRDPGAADVVNPFQLIYSEPQNYEPTFVLKLLANWFKDDAASPKRQDSGNIGSFLLPSIRASAVQPTGSQQYKRSRRHRRSALRRLAEMPNQNWCEGDGYCFDESCTVLGSPFFDQVLHGSEKIASSGIKKLLKDVSLHQDLNFVPCLSLGFEVVPLSLAEKVTYILELNDQWSKYGDAKLPLTCISPASLEGSHSLGGTAGASSVEGVCSARAPKIVELECIQPNDRHASAPNCMGSKLEVEVAARNGVHDLGTTASEQGSVASFTAAQSEPNSRVVQTDALTCLHSLLLRMRKVCFPGSLDCKIPSKTSLPRNGSNLSEKRLRERRPPRNSTLDRGGGNPAPKRHSTGSRAPSKARPHPHEKAMLSNGACKHDHKKIAPRQRSDTATIGPESGKIKSQSDSRVRQWKRDSRCDIGRKWSLGSMNCSRKESKDGARRINYEAREAEVEEAVLQVDPRHKFDPANVIFRDRVTYYVHSWGSILHEACFTCFPKVVVPFGARIFLRRHGLMCTLETSLASTCAVPCILFRFTLLDEVCGDLVLVDWVADFDANLQKYLVEARLVNPWKLPEVSKFLCMTYEKDLKLVPWADQYASRVEKILL